MVHLNLGLALHELGRHDEAIDEIQIALGFYPDSAILYTALGRSLEAKGRP